MNVRILLAATAVSAASVCAERAALAQVSNPLPGVVLVQHDDASMTIADLCASGVSVRATKYDERQATPQDWAQRVGAQVAINADFFEFPGWSWVLVRARGAGEEWPASAEKLEQPSGYWQFGPGVSGLQASSLVAPPAGVTDVVGAYDPLIEGGKPHVFTPDETFMLANYRRSAIGLSADRSHLYFFASNAVTNGPAMASRMIALAAEAGAPPIDVATNQDGGGSSQLYVQGLGQVVTSGRQVADHLGVFASGQGGAPNCPLQKLDAGTPGGGGSGDGDASAPNGPAGGAPPPSSAIDAGAPRGDPAADGDGADPSLDSGSGGCACRQSRVFDRTPEPFALLAGILAPAIAWRRRRLRRVTAFVSRRRR